MILIITKCLILKWELIEMEYKVLYEKILKIVNEKQDFKLMFDSIESFNDFHKFYTEVNGSFVWNFNDEEEQKKYFNFEYGRNISQRMIKDAVKSGVCIEVKCERTWSRTRRINYGKIYNKNIISKYEKLGYDKDAFYLHVVK